MTAGQARVSSMMHLRCDSGSLHLFDDFQSLVIDFIWPTEYCACSAVVSICLFFTTQRA